MVTSAQRLSAELHDGAARRDPRPASRRRSAISRRCFPPAQRRAPIVTVIDGASHALTFLGGAFGVPVVPLGVDSFGQSGTIADLYAYAGIDADHIVEAALLALNLEAH